MPKPPNFGSKALSSLKLLTRMEREAVGVGAVGRIKQDVKGPKMSSVRVKVVTMYWDEVHCPVGHCHYSKGVHFMDPDGTLRLCVSSDRF